jgi:hypothetical protein
MMTIQNEELLHLFDRFQNYLQIYLEEAKFCLDLGLTLLQSFLTSIDKISEVFSFAVLKTVLHKNLWHRCTGGLCEEES